MPQPSDISRDLKALRNKVIGLGDESVRKSYYPELQQRLIELQESEARFKAIFDSVSDAIFVHDIETFRILEVNQSSCNLFACTYEQALNLTIEDATSIDQFYNLKRVEPYLKKAVDGIPQHFEWHAKTFAGVPFWVEVNVRRARIGKEDRLLATMCDITERKQAEEEKRVFYRDTILSATDGKLDVCEYSDIESHVNQSVLNIIELNPESRSNARYCVEELLHDCSLAEDRINDFMIGVGEAIANVLKHCGKGILYAGFDNTSVWVVITDTGSGIDSLVLPKAVLKKGFSTKPSMGLGYSIMLEVCDKIMLATGKEGTRVVLVKDFKTTEEISLDNIPDTWEGITKLA